MNSYSAQDTCDIEKQLDEHSVITSKILLSMYFLVMLKNLRQSHLFMNNINILKVPNR